MEQLRSQLVELVTRISSQEGLHATAIPGVHSIRVSQTQKRSKRLWAARLGIIVQGCKEIVLGRRVYRFEGFWYTAAPIDLPVVSRIAAATPEEPFLGLLIDLDPLMLSEIALQIESSPVDGSRPQRALFGGEADDAMLEAAVRLSRLCLAPEDARILGPLVIKELLYRLLTGPDGAAISQFVRSGSTWHRIFHIIYRMKSALHEEVDVNALAKAARMSRSAFFRAFHEVTALSPIQYQKRLRLLEARRLMIEEGETAEGSAFRVGYKSASQFSREYARLFGQPPMRDVLNYFRVNTTLPWTRVAPALSRE